MLALTNNASEVIEGILSAPIIPDGSGVRITPSPGVDAADAELEVMLAPRPARTDRVIDDGGARVFVDDAAAELLDDKLLDASVDEDQVQFRIGAQAH